MNGDTRTSTKVGKNSSHGSRHRWKHNRRRGITWVGRAGVEQEQTLTAPKRKRRQGRGTCAPEKQPGDAQWCRGEDLERKERRRVEEGRMLRSRARACEFFNPHIGAASALENPPTEPADTCYDRSDSS